MTGTLVETHSLELLSEGACVCQHLQGSPATFKCEKHECPVYVMFMFIIVPLKYNLRRLTENTQADMAFSQDL